MKRRFLLLFAVAAGFTGCETTPAQQATLDRALAVVADAAVRRVVFEIEPHPSK